MSGEKRKKVFMWMMKIIRDFYALMLMNRKKHTKTISVLITFSTSFILSQMLCNFWRRSFWSSLISAAETTENNAIQMFMARKLIFLSFHLVNANTKNFFTLWLYNFNFIISQPQKEKNFALSERKSLRNRKYF